MAGKNVALKSVGLGEQRSALGEITNVTTRRVTAGKSSKQVTRFSFFTFCLCGCRECRAGHIIGQVGGTYTLFVLTKARSITEAELRGNDMIGDGGA